MRVVVALGGNALLRRGQPVSAETQRTNIKIAAAAIARILDAGHQVVITHGNGPQIGLLALANNAFPLDVLGAETDGMIGYVLQQELDNAYTPDAKYATLLTQIKVDAIDPAFARPTKPIGQIYERFEAEKLSASRGWSMIEEGGGWRRVVPSPKPVHIMEIDVIRLLLGQNVIVICAGGGGIPVVERDDGTLTGIEAVIDKDHASEMLAREINADAFLMLTDVDGVYRDWGGADQTRLHHVAPRELKSLTFAEGSMAPKVNAACDFVLQTGGMAAIGPLESALDMVEGRAGTVVRQTH